MTLDERMEHLRLALTVAPDGTTVSYNSGGGRSSEHPGGKRPPGSATTLAEDYIRRYQACRTDTARVDVIAEGWAELRGDPSKRPERLTDHDEIALMLAETERMTPEEIETSRFRMPARLVRRHRTQAGRHGETGLRLADRQDPASQDERAGRARALRAEGNTIGNIAMRLRVPKPTVQGWLDGRRRRAA